MAIFTLFFIFLVTSQAKLAEAVAGDDPLSNSCSDYSMASILVKTILDQERALAKCEEQNKANKIIPDFSKFNTPKEFNKKSYYLSKIKENATEAVKLCSAIGGYLAEVNDKNEFQFVKTFKSSNIVAIFISGSDAVTEGKWISQRTGQLLPFFEWLDTEPNSLGGNEDCLSVWEMGSIGMNDISCERQENFLCEV